MVKLVNTTDLKSVAVRLAGSSPAVPTNAEYPAFLLGQLDRWFAGRGFAVANLLVCSLLLIPLLLVDVPPILDYPNHLARLYLLAFAAADPVLSQMYAAHWHVIPNLVIDASIPPLIRMLPLHVAGRIMLGVTLLLPLQGIIAYQRTASGTRSLWPLTGALVVYNGLFLMGFANFLISCGLALLAAAGWDTYRATYPRLTIAGAAAAAVLLFFCHLIGDLLFFVLIGSSELEAIFARRASSPGYLGNVGARIFALVTIGIPPLALLMAVGFAPAHSATQWIAPLKKLLELFTPMLNYSTGFDMASLAVMLCALAFAMRHRWIACRKRAWIALAALGLMFLAAPFEVSDGAYFDFRFPVMAGFTAVAGLMPLKQPRVVAATTFICLATLFAIRMTIVSTVWNDHNRDIAELRETIASVPGGSRVLAAQVSLASAPAYWAQAPRGRKLNFLALADMHMPAFLVFERRAFWPLLFAVETQQPLVVLPPYRQISKPVGRLPDYHLLGEDNLPANLQSSYPYLANWQNNFDYVLLMDAGGEPDLTHFLPERLQLVHATDMAALFRVLAPPSKTR